MSMNRRLGIRCMIIEGDGAVWWCLSDGEDERGAVCCVYCTYGSAGTTVWTGGAAFFFLFSCFVIYLCAFVCLFPFSRISQFFFSISLRSCASSRSHPCSSFSCLHLCSSSPSLPPSLFPSLYSCPFHLITPDLCILDLPLRSCYTSYLQRTFRVYSKKSVH